MLEKLEQKILSSTPFGELANRESESGSPVVLQGVSGSLWAFVAAKLYDRFRGQLLLISAEKDQAEKLRDDCSLLVGENSVKLCAVEPTHESHALDLTGLISQVEALQALAKQAPGILVTHASALAFGVPKKEVFLSSVMSLSRKAEIEFDNLLGQLVERGFERKQFVETYGDFAVRGGIVDVFPFIGENPIRLEFWGDIIESLREFDVLSQRSLRELEEVTIVPDTGVMMRKAGLKSNILEYLSGNVRILTEDFQLLEREFQELESEGVLVDFAFQEVVMCLGRFPLYIHSAFHHNAPDASIDFHSSPQPPCNGNVKVLLDQVGQFKKKQMEVVLASDTKDEMDRLRDLVEETSNSGNGYEDVEYVAETFHSGFIFPPANLVLFTEHEIFDRLKRRAVMKRWRFKGLSQKELHSLHKGDYVVHIDHGVGRFWELVKINVGGAEQEVLRVEYDEGGVLYVNLSYVGRVQKYSSAEGHTPKLNKLGGGEWERLKGRAKRKIKDIARDLILLYAKRKKEPGFTFSPDTHWQREMEASFMFDDTPDQSKATLEVKVDMERPSPMDRLVCGDVGFGKTELAVRAAFKAVQDNKQVTVLVPTTILAEQHYRTFLDRLNRYPVRVETLTRFKSPTEQKNIIERLKSGQTDIVIGTHRLLSPDVVFKDLGLLVIDEEQRFGVTAKEKLRVLKAGVDTLALTATPIPRTLHFSLMGARDLSLINTPPRNRLPIHTEIAQFDAKIIREAVIKELHRGGQVFVVNDRVQNIDSFTSVLQRYIPEAKFNIAHGQMHGHRLEKVMMDFLDKKFDVLVTTKIIESGLDIPSVNTIVINRADKFGLAELYQLRGRVGRSNVQAYAYLLVPAIASLPKATLRRLQAIEEFTELGSGFNLAMRDLEIRGAGNMLGAAQSGFILEMGLEMYTRLLEETVVELKEQEFSEIFPSLHAQAFRKPEVVIETDLEARIPEFYVEDDNERLDIYRRLYSASTDGAIEDIRSEFLDRFGDPVIEVEHLLSLSKLKITASQAGFQKVEMVKHALRLFFPDDSEKSFFESGKFQSILDKVSLMRSNKPELKQEGKRLFLRVFLGTIGDEERIEEARAIVKQFAA